MGMVWCGLSCKPHAICVVDLVTPHHIMSSITSLQPAAPDAHEIQNRIRAAQVHTHERMQPHAMGWDGMHMMLGHVMSWHTSSCVVQSSIVSSTPNPRVRALLLVYALSIVCVSVAAFAHAGYATNARTAIYMGMRQQHTTHGMEQHQHMYA